MERKSIVVIGAGPAGIACSMQLVRFGFAPFLIERGRVGGLLRQAHFVENYPGFPKGITGKALVRKFKLHLDHYGISIHTAQVTGLEYRKDHFCLKLDGDEMEADTVVVATGTQPKKLISSDARINGAIHYDIQALLPLGKKRIAIIGGGDAAFDYALALSETNRVSMFFRRSGPSCLPLLYTRARSRDSIRLHGGCEVHGIQQIEGGFAVQCEKVRGPDTLFDRVLCAIGRIPSTECLSRKLLRAFKNGKAIPNLHYIGDVRQENNRQVAIAVGDGIHAAMEIYERVKRGEHGA
jgi:thioredoxin reductase (NADPH)